MEADILLVKALGGNWNVSDLPKVDKGGFPHGAFVPLGQ
jgi:hypothetical protein